MAEMLASADAREKSRQQQAKSFSGGFRDQTSTRNIQDSQSSTSASKTPSTAKKAAAVAKEHAENGEIDEGDFRSGAVGNDGDAKKKRSRPKIDADLITGSTGLAAILKTFPSLKHELKGEGHEAQDVRLLISRFQVSLPNPSSRSSQFSQMWSWRMAPAVSFSDSVAMLEKLGHTVRLQVVAAIALQASLIG
jgi:hypothetical protein